MRRAWRAMPRGACVASVRGPAVLSIAAIETGVRHDPHAVAVRAAAA